jgi:RNA polymerase sigma-70 factor (ECF subfamily)
MSDDELREENDILNRSRTDPRAFGLIYERYVDRIFNFILRQTGDEQLADDLCSQTFYNALRTVGSYEPRGFPYSAWLYKVASNEINKHYRKQKSNRVFSLEEGRVKEILEQADERWDDETISRLLAYMNDLPTDMLQVLELRFFEGKEFSEIAFILDLTESGAKMRTYRALDQLRKKFNLKVRYHG